MPANFTTDAAPCSDQNKQNLHTTFITVDLYFSLTPEWAIYLSLCKFKHNCSVMIIDCDVANRIFNEILLAAMNFSSLFIALFVFRFIGYYNRQIAGYNQRIFAPHLDRPYQNIVLCPCRLWGIIESTLGARICHTLNLEVFVKE
jgi:hypothetical protein